MGIKCSSCNAFKRSESVLSPIKSRNLPSYSKYKSETLMSPNKTSKKPTLVMPKLYTSKTCPLSQKISKLLNEAKLVFIPECLIKENNDSPDKKYIIIRKIGQGGFGKVYYAKDKVFQKEVAIKKILKDKNNENNVYNLRILNEINILKKQCHPSIIKIYEVFNNTDEYYIVNEYCKFGDLVGQLKNGLDEMQISNILFQILSGISYLHFHGIIHRDLKLENIGIIDKNTIKIKLFDFGLSKIIGNYEKTNESYGSFFYCPPEVLNNQSYDFKVDIWPFGIIIYYLLFHKFPFETSNNNNQTQDERIKIFIQKVSHVGHIHIDEKSAKNKQQKIMFELLKRTIVKEPEKRSTINEIIHLLKSS